MDLLPNLTIVPMWLIFVASVWVINRFMIQPSLKIVQARAAKTSGLESELDHLKLKTEQMMQQYDQTLNAARQKAQAERDRILKDAEAEKKSILTAARAEADQMMVDAKAKIAAEIQSIDSQINAMADVAAQDLVTHFVQ